MLTLYHFDRSTAAQKVRLSLAEKGLKWKSRIIDPSLDAREQHDPEYLRLNPRGVVPTLIHDGKAIRESQVIVEYLEDVFSTPSLRPADPFQRAQMRIWTKLIDEHLHVDSRTIGQCVAMRHLMLKVDPVRLKAHYAAMPEEVRRDNDLINNEKGLESPLLPGALRRFKRVFWRSTRRFHGNPGSLATPSRSPIFRMWFTSRGWIRFSSQVSISRCHISSIGSVGLARPSWAEAVEKWGDTSSAARVKHGREAYPKVKAIWDAA